MGDFYPIDRRRLDRELLELSYHRGPNAVRHEFVIVEGWVTSQTDGQRHRIPASRLIRLYGLGPGHRWRVMDRSHRRMWEYSLPHLVPLEPRFDGDYSLAAAVARWRPRYLIRAEEIRRDREAATRWRLDNLGAALDDFEGRYPHRVPEIRVQQALRSFRAQREALLRLGEAGAAVLRSLHAMNWALARAGGSMGRKP